MAYVSNSGFNGTGTIGSISYSHATGTESNPVLWIAVYMSDTVSTVSSVTVDSGAATYVGRHQDPLTTWSVELWRMDGVTGTVDVDVTLAAPAEMCSCSVLTSDADVVRDIAGAYQFVASGSDATIDVTLDSETTDTILSFVSKNGAGVLTNNGTLRAEHAVSDYKAVATHTAGSGTTNPIWTTASASSTEVALLAISIQEVTVEEQHYTITADQGAYTYTGQAAALISGGDLTAEQGSYSLLGSEAAVDIEMDAVQGSYALSGQAADIENPKTLPAAQGAYLLNGQNAALSYSGAVIAAVEYIVRNVRRVMRRGWAHFGRY